MLLWQRKAAEKYSIRAANNRGHTYDKDVSVSRGPSLKKA